MLWLIGTAFALRNFLTLTTLGGSPEFFEKISIYWFLEGSGHSEKFRASTDKKKLTPKKSKKKVEFFFWLPFQKMWFRQKRGNFLSSSAPGAPYRGRDTEKTQPFSGPKKFLTRKKVEKRVEHLIFRCGFKKCVRVENGAIFAIFFPFRPLVPPARGAH